MIQMFPTTTIGPTPNPFKCLTYPFKKKEGREREVEGREREREETSFFCMHVCFFVISPAQKFCLHLDPF